MQLNEKDVLDALSRARDGGKDRKFDESVDVMVNFKNIDFKKASNRISVDVNLPFSTRPGRYVSANASAFSRTSGLISVQVVSNPLTAQRVEIWCPMFPAPTTQICFTSSMFIWLPFAVWKYPTGIFTIGLVNQYSIIGLFDQAVL